MLTKIAAVSALAVSVLAAPTTLPDTSSLDLITLFNQTRGFSYLSKHVGFVPQIAAALNNMTNVTVLAPSDIALRLFPWDPRYEELESYGIDFWGGEVGPYGAGFFQALIGYHILDGVHDNLTTSFAPLKTSLRGAPWTTVPGGQVVMGRYDYRTFEAAFISGRSAVAEAPVGIPFKGGIVYPIDDVLNIPRGLTAELTEGEVNGTAFLALLGKAGLLAEAQNFDQATYFVPTDEAIKAVERSLNALSTEDLAAVLSYHIIPNEIVYSSLIKNGTSLTTLQGQEVHINQQRRFFVQNARVLGNDVLTKNGVVHMIDNVLNPEFIVPAQNATQGDGVPAFALGGGFN